MFAGPRGVNGTCPSGRGKRGNHASEDPSRPTVTRFSYKATSLHITWRKTMLNRDTRVSRRSLPSSLRAEGSTEVPRDPQASRARGIRVIEIFLSSALRMYRVFVVFPCFSVLSAYSGTMERLKGGTGKSRGRRASYSISIFRLFSFELHTGSLSLSPFLSLSISLSLSPPVCLTLFYSLIFQILSFPSLLQDPVTHHTDEFHRVSSFSSSSFSASSMFSVPAATGSRHTHRDKRTRAPAPHAHKILRAPRFRKHRLAINRLQGQSRLSGCFRDDLNKTATQCMSFLRSKSKLIFKSLCACNCD